MQVDSLEALAFRAAGAEMRRANPPGERLPYAYWRRRTHAMADRFRQDVGTFTLSLSAQSEALLLHS